jgi:ATP-binding protein involved in chromosome partitioning
MDLVPEKKLNPKIKGVIGVISGKGGVGKSTVAVLLAEALAARGRKVGMMDADITGPSLPRLMGLDSFRAETNGEAVIPLASEEGIGLVSINLLAEREDEPVIWRGPLLGRAIEQFWTDADWGELDYLIIDFPPGTSDIALTAFQTIPISGLVVVATPQDYVSMIVAKSVKMATMLKAPLIGFVENMGSLVCPTCGETISLFDDGSERVDAIAGMRLLARLPWRKEVAQAPSIRWAALPAAARDEADAIADGVEAALAGRSCPAQPLPAASRN